MIESRHVRARPIYIVSAMADGLCCRPPIHAIRELLSKHKYLLTQTTHLLQTFNAIIAHQGACQHWPHRSATRIDVPDTSSSWSLSQQCAHLVGRAPARAGERANGQVVVAPPLPPPLPPPPRLDKQTQIKRSCVCLCASRFWRSNGGWSAHDRVKIMIHYPLGYSGVCCRQLYTDSVCHG